MQRNKGHLTLTLVVLLLFGGIAPGAATSDEIPVYLDGQLLYLSDPPMLKDGRTLAPMRGFFEALGATVNWESQTQTAVGTRDGITVRIPIGSTTPTVDGVIVPIDVPAQIINGRTYIPLRFVGEALGDAVAWDSATRSVRITKKQETVSYQPACLEDASRIIRVPEDYSRIQLAINAAKTGDGVLVGPGTYIENIDFRGKNITVTSSDGPEVTIISGGYEGSAVTFKSGEGPDAVLHGFTVKNGMSGMSGADDRSEAYPSGGGISIRNASPTIVHCLITNNAATDFGAGISIDGSSSRPVIENNVITRNISHYQAAGISVRGGAAPTIRGNTIANNLCEAAAGILVASGSSGVIENNVIRDNIPGYDLTRHQLFQYLQSDAAFDQWLKEWGQHPAFPGGILIVQGSDPIVRNNVITGNDGGGIGILLGSTPRIEGNTISYNGNADAASITGGVMVGHDSTVTLSGNTLIGNLGPDIWLDHRNSTIIDQNGTVLKLQGQTRPSQVGDNKVSGIVVAWPLERPAPQPNPNPRTIQVPGDCVSIQAAIDAARDGDTIVVAPGTYNETIDYRGKHITVRSQDPLNESIVASTVINGGNSQAPDSGQGPIVMFLNSEGREAVLEGFTLHNRNSGFFLQSAVFLSGASPTIRNNIIISNNGEGILMNAAYTPLFIPDEMEMQGRFTVKPGTETAPLIENNVIRDCGRGGMWFYYASPEIINNRFINNVGPISGAVHNWFSRAVIKDNVFTDNYAQENGGAIHFESLSVVQVEGNHFEGNAAKYLGGGIYIDSPTRGTISGNMLIGNRSRPGAAITIGAGAEVVVANNVIAENYGWAVFVGGASGVLINNTFANNYDFDGKSNYEGLFVMGNGTVTGVNNIFYNSELNIYLDETDSSINLTHSLFFGQGAKLWSGEGNRLRDPLFVGPRDYRLRSGSPAINAGAAVDLQTDILGTARPQGGGFDIGAYEFIAP